MTTNLEPCPFCGGIDLDGESNGDGGEWVYCNACWADGPMARTNDGETAEHLWNTRSSDKNAKLVEALTEARLQLEYMDERSPSGTTPAVIARINHALGGSHDDPCVEAVARAIAPHLRSTLSTTNPDCDDQWQGYEQAAYVAGLAIAAMHSSRPVEDGMRQQGQDEGFAAAVQWLRDRGAMKPRASLWSAAAELADQMEQSRIPRQALTPEKAATKAGDDK